MLHRSRLSFIFAILALTSTVVVPMRASLFDFIQRHPFATAMTATTSVVGGVYAKSRIQDYITTEDGAATPETSGLHWNWDDIHAQNPEFFANPQQAFAPEFEFGAGTSYFQIEGAAENTDYYHWSHEDPSRVQHLIGDACDSWNRWQEDIDAAYAFGLQRYRLSIDWSKVEPTPGIYDQDAINRYKEMIEYTEAKGMSVLIGFHHYTDPQWFVERGAFTNTGNIDSFVNFCAKMVAEVGHAPGRLWATFNSPTGYVFHKYHIGDFPPGTKGDLKLTMHALKNMLEAHVRVYKACKLVDPNAQIGILKNIMHLDPWRADHKIDNFVCELANKMQNDCIFDFFANGTFKVKVPFSWLPVMANVEHTNEDAPNSLDFIGINHYSHSYMKNGTKIKPPFEEPTQNENYTIYPEGMYRAIKLVHERMVQPIKERTGREIPAYVTENGLAHADPQVRLNFFQRTMYAMHKAIQDGYPVQGYVYWSLLDNYEWGSYDKKYGLVQVDFPIGGNGTLARTIKTDAGTNWFRNLVTKHKQ